MNRTLTLPIALLAAPLLAQETSSPNSSVPTPYAHSAAPSIRAARVAGTMTVDGRLDEQSWSAATPTSAFTQFDPKEGAAPSEKTEVRVLIDDAALYVGARLYESNAANIRPRLSRRDESVDGDVFAVAIDSRHDHLSAYYFRVTAGGAIRDAVVNPDDGGLDLSWDAVWDASVTTNSDGWTVEIRIPFSQLPYNRVSDPVWGIQFERFRWNQFEQDFFAFTPKNEQGGVQRYGHLTGLGALPPPSRIELLPYVSTRAEHLDIAPDNPFRDGSDYFADVGADLKYRLTSNVTLNATVNPDFGQVEVDPAVVNLTAFETFFPEKRPFFIEGRELFRFGQLRTFNSGGSPTLFFSRRIGRQPQRGIGDLAKDDAVTGEDLADIPEQSTIIAASKLTGKTSSGWSLGLLDAVTAREKADFVDELDTRRSAVVEPLTNYLVARPRRELNDGNTVAGALLSAVHRDLDDPALESLLRSEAYIGGFDLNHSWDERRWALDASVAGSLVRGGTDAIARTQFSSSRYYNRPDAKSFRFDPARTELSGYTGQVAVTKTAGTHWLGNLAYQATSPGFESNDLGFQTNADRRALSTMLFYRENRLGRFFRNYATGVFTNQTWNHDGDIVFNNYAGFFEARFLDFSGVDGRVDFGAPSFDDRLTRGGPVTRQLRGLEVELEYSTDRRKVYSAEAEISHGRDDGGFRRTRFTIGFAVQPAPSLRITLSPEYITRHTEAQFIATIADATATRTYGQRYIFAPLDQREASLVTRVDWTFTPRLSLQTFIQPLISTGDFGDRKSLRAPRTFEFDPYPGSVGDFNFRSLIGNAVLRWEYRPGSTLFFVWQQFRDGEERFGDFRFGRDSRALFREKPENVFAVKGTYWIAK